MTDLAGHSIRTMPDFVIEYNTATHSGSESNENHTADTVSRTAPMLSQGCSVGIILYENRKAELALQLILKWEFIPVRKIRRFYDDAGIHLNDTGCTDTHAPNIQPSCNRRFA